MEETGYYPNELKHLTSFYTSPGFSNEIIHLFLAKNLIKRREMLILTNIYRLKR